MAFLYENELALRWERGAGAGGNAVSTITLTVLEFIDEEFPTVAQLWDRFGCLLDVARDELLAVFRGWTYIIGTTSKPAGGCYMCCYDWREHIRAWWGKTEGLPKRRHRRP